MWNLRQCGDCCWELEDIKKMGKISVINWHSISCKLLVSAHYTFDKPLAVPIDRVVSWPICDIAWWSPQNLPVALAVPCLAWRWLSQQQNHQDNGDREGGGHHWHRLEDGKQRVKNRPITTKNMQQMWTKLLNFTCIYHTRQRNYTSRIYRELYESKSQITYCSPLHIYILHFLLTDLTALQDACMVVP